MAIASDDILGYLMEDDDGVIQAGSIVVIADGSKNSFKGTNVARLNKVSLNEDDGYTTSHIGTYVKAQEKMYKLDGAFHSRRSMVIGLEDGATSGTLNITSEYEGLDSEMHMVIDSGTINVTADDDGINVNEDDTSVFIMTGGSLTVTAGGDGIDSNGYVVFTGADKLSITSSGAGDNAIDYDVGMYMADAVKEIYNGTGGEGGDPGTDPGTGGGTGPGDPDDEDTATPTTLMSITDTNGNEIASVKLNATAIKYDETEQNARDIPASSTDFKLVLPVNNFGNITDN